MRRGYQDKRCPVNHSCPKNSLSGVQGTIWLSWSSSDKTNAFPEGVPSLAVGQASLLVNSRWLGTMSTQCTQYGGVEYSVSKQINLAVYCTIQRAVPTQ